MFIIRAAHVAHGTCNAARALACVEEFQGAGHAVTVTDAAGRRLDAADLRSLAVAGMGEGPRAAAGR